MSRTRNSIARETLALLGVRPFTAHRSRTVRAANARLVAITGLALLLLLPVPYATALSLDLLWRVHYFSSLLLIPLLAVKLAATGGRAVRFYLGDSGFREDGPPHPMPRITAPILVLSTVVLFLSGVEMPSSSVSRWQQQRCRFHSGSAPDRQARIIAMAEAASAATVQLSRWDGTVAYPAAAR